MLTVLIATFMRPDALQRLKTSIRRFYPDLPILVASDDGSEADIMLPYDSGLSAKRNALVERCTTEYCLILDDDCIFTDKTNLEALIQEMKDRSLDVLQPKVTGVEYAGVFEITDDSIKVVKGNRMGLYDMVLNIFLARTDKLKQCKWNEDVKMGEHTVFFYENRGKMWIGTSDKCEIEHKHVDTPGYSQFRSRAHDYIKGWMGKNKIKTIVNIYGQVIEL